MSVSPTRWPVGRTPWTTYANVRWTRSQHLIETLESDLAKTPAYYLPLENVIVWCMPEKYPSVILPRLRLPEAACAVNCSNV